MPNHALTETALETPQDRIKEIIYQIRRLMQAGELFTKELNKTYQVSAPQLHCLLALYEQEANECSPVKW